MTQRVKIIVVDDAPDSADMMAAALELEGYEAQVAFDGVQALELMEQVRPDVVLLDVAMPRMGGAELTRVIRERWGEGIVLVAVSGSDPQDPAVRETYDNVDYFMRKPVDLAALRKLLRL